KNHKRESCRTVAASENNRHFARRFAGAAFASHESGRISESTKTLANVLATGEYNRRLCRTRASHGSNALASGLCFHPYFRFSLKSFMAFVRPTCILCSSLIGVLLNQLAASSIFSNG